MHTPTTILFVDDEQQETKYFKRAFSSTFQIETANSVESAITILDEKHSEIAVVITDQRMPNRPGLELLEFTHKQYPHIVRVLTTAFCDMDSALDAINEAEIFRYIPKPWDLDHLEETINLAVSRHHSIRRDTKATDQKEKILSDLDDDCRHWLMYALHAYGDEDVYKSGLEALACRYYIVANQSCDKAEAKALKQKIDTLIEKEYLGQDVIADLLLQKDKGFDIPGSTTFKAH